MRKLMLALVCLALPFAFWSCEDTEELIGAIDIKIEDESHDIPNAFFTELSGVTTIAGTNIKESVAVAFKGSSEKTYTLGLGKDALSAAANIMNIGSMENTLVYIPSSGVKDDGITAVCGTLKITEYTSTKVEGEFSGYGVKSSIITSGNVDWSNLQSNLQEISGTFTAVGKK